MSKRDLNGSQRDALRWLWIGCWRPWHGPFSGDPATPALMALVRKGLARKKGGDGFTPYYALTDEGRRLHPLHKEATP